MSVLGFSSLSCLSIPSAGVAINWMGYKIKGANTAALHELMISLKLKLHLVGYSLYFWMVNYNTVYHEKAFFFLAESRNKRKTTEVIKNIELCCVLLEMFLLPQDMRILKFEHR